MARSAHRARAEQREDAEEDEDDGGQPTRLNNDHDAPVAERRSSPEQRTKTMAVNTGCETLVIVQGSEA